MYTYNKYMMDGNIRIYRQLGYEEPLHLHDFMEFVYIIRGKYVHTVDNIQYPVTKGDLVVINYNQTHGFYSDCNSEHYNILIKPEFISEKIEKHDDVFALLELTEYGDFKNLIDKQNPVISFSKEEQKKVETIIGLLESEFEKTDFGQRVVTHSCVNLLLAMIFRKMSHPKPVSNEIINKETLDYIKEHCGEKITLKTLCRQGHYDVSYFSRMFKKYTGVTFTKYLKDIRIECACDLLKSTDDKVNDIYIKVGYSDKTKFFKDFKSYTNTTPLKYRNSQN